MNKTIVTIAIILGVAVSFLLGMNLGKAPSSLGGSTSANWSVGGNLTVTGTSGLTGALTQTGAATFSNTVTISGETSVGNFIAGGAIASVDQSGTTSTDPSGELTAANVCDNSYVSFISNTSSALVLYPPNATATIADCLTAAGKNHRFILRNATSGGSITITATTGVNIFYATGSDAIIAPKTMAEIWVIATSTSGNGGVLWNVRKLAE